MLDYLLSGSLRACTPSLFFRREAFLAIKFDDSLRQHQDYDFNCRFHERFNYYCCDEPTVKVHLTSSGENMGKSPHHPSCLKVIKSYASNVQPSNLVNYCKNMVTKLTLENHKYAIDYFNIANENAKAGWSRYYVYMIIWRFCGIRTLNWVESFMHKIYKIMKIKKF